MADFSDLNTIRIDSIKVKEILNSPVKFDLLTGESGMDNTIVNKYLNRPQFLLTGFDAIFNNKSIQLFGNTETMYLNSLSPKKRLASIRKLFSYNIPCIIITNNNKIDPFITEIAKIENIAIFRTEADTIKATMALTEFLDDLFAIQTVLHGSFVDVFGVGILLAGRSGIGKSEIALDLIERGHRLVADDVVMLTKKSESVLMGTGTSLVQHFMEIRGLGIIDVRQMFGIRSIRFQKRLEIIVELLEWNKNEEYTRIGLDEQTSEILGIEISTVKLPIFPGKNITVIAETIAINYLLRTYGYNAAKEFTNKLKNEIQLQKINGIHNKEKRAVNWFQFDKE